MLQHQDQPVNSVYGGQGGTGSDDASSPSLRNRKGDKDGNFNFLPGHDEDVTMTRNMGGGGGGGDENRNQVRPRNLSPLGRDPPSSVPSPGFHHGSKVLSPLSRLPCWSPLEPLPEIESGDDSYGRVPPDGAEERKMVVDETKRLIMMTDNNERERKMKMAMLRASRDKDHFRGGEDEDDDEQDLDDDEWGDSDSELEYSYRSSGSMSSLNMESGGEGMLMGGWDRIGVGEPKSDQQVGGIDANALEAAELNLEKKCIEFTKEPGGRRKSVSRKLLPGGVQEEAKEGDHEDQSSDSDGELPELMDTVWTLRDREQFKAQEMEKHQVQLTMYRRLALIRWVRTLQGRVQEQQDRLQSSFDVILTHRKELLRMGAAAAVTAAAPPTPAVAQS